MNWRTIIKSDIEMLEKHSQYPQNSSSSPDFTNIEDIEDVNPALKSTDSELIKCGTCYHFELNTFAPWGIGECDIDIPQPGEPAWPNEPRICKKWKQHGHVV